jgi:hypothetical protein
MTKRNPFDFVKSVSYGKTDIMVDEVDEKAYVPFLTNKALSYHEDAIHFVNEINTRYDMDNRLQYRFFLNTLRKRQRFSKWDKPKEDGTIDVVKEYYGISTDKAKEYVKLLTSEQCNQLRQRMKTGGKNNNDITGTDR